MINGPGASCPERNAVATSGGSEHVAEEDLEGLCEGLEQSPCVYHLGLMIECWEEAEGCPEGCDGSDNNGVTLWDCLYPPP